MESDSRVAPIAFRKPSAARSPPTLRILSLNTGSYSTQCPSPSTIGWSILERTCSGVIWALIIFSGKLRLNTVDCAGNASAAPQAIGIKHCTWRKAARHLRRVHLLTLLTAAARAPGSPRSGAHTPGDGVAQQCNERPGFPRASKSERRRVRGVGGPGRADGGVVAMAESKVGHAAVADLTCIAKHAGPAVGL